jgi:hypothetical protein
MGVRLKIVKRNSIMKNWLIVFTATIALASCNGKSKEKKFEVSGIITNNTAKMIYLEEIPVATMQRIVVDSVIVSKSGKYILKADSKEAMRL